MVVSPYVGVKEPARQVRLLDNRSLRCIPWLGIQDNEVMRPLANANIGAIISLYSARSWHSPPSTMWDLHIRNDTLLAHFDTHNI